MYMKTLIITGNDVRNDIEEKTISNWVAEYLKREMCRHRDAKILDHPDKSVTSTKIADNAITQNKIINGAVTTDKVVNRCITRSKLSNDVVGDLKKASMFIYYDGEPVYLSECRYLTGLGYGFPEDIPINVLFKLENDTNNSLSEFRIHDEHYTPLSCTIAPGETRICVLVREEISGADPQNGYLFVLDDSDVKKMISSETKQRQSADNALQRGIDAETKSRQMGDSELQTKIDTETADRKTSDGELNGKKADKTELYGTDETTKHTVTYSLTAADMAVSIDAGHSKGTVTVSDSTVKEKILLDGNSIQAAELSAMFGCGKGEDGDKYICIYYSPETGTLTMTVEDVETSPEEGTIALMTVGYNTATVTTMYNRAQTFTGINNLNGLKTNNKNSFLEAVNEISTKLTTEISDRMDENDSLSDRINTETGERQAADMQLSARINAIGNKAPLNHASTGTTYGVGDATNYGHLKLSDSTTSTSSTSSGIAATPKAVKMSYDKAVSAYNLADTKLGKDFVSGGYTGIDEVTARLNGIEEGAEVNTVTSVAGMTGDVTLTKENVGLSDVENVSTNEQTPTFTEASTRANITSGETLSTLFGKIKKLFTDLKTVAFTGSYTDLSNKPTSMQNPNSLTLTMNGSATSYNGSATASKSWYAPTSAGTAGYSLIGSGSGAPVWKQPPYAVCGDSPSISDRRVSITNFKLVTGVRVLVRFTYPFAGTQGKVTLNVNSTGAKEVKLLRADGSYDAITQYNSWSTNEIVEFVYDGTYWVALSSDKQFVSGKPSVITVGSSTVTRYCDFKCSGTDDDIVIQKAMDSLTDGGKIILLEGTYNLSSRLLQKKNVVIEGQGRGITKVNTSYIFLVSRLSGTSPTLHLTNMDINFLSTSNISPNAGAFNDYDVLQIDNCSISYANTMHNTDSIFFNCKVKLKNSRISVTLPAKRYDNSHPCWWIFRDCTAEIIDTDIIFPTTSNNTLSNGVFYRCEGSMVGGFIKHIGTTVSSNHSYIEDDSTMNIIGTQIECRRFSQSETTTGNFNSLANCRIKILQAEGYFSASHINHCDLYISASVIFCAYCMASNCKLWFSAASLATLKNYCFFEACYTNQSTWIGTNGTGTSTTDTKTVSGMAAPSFRSVS